MNIKQNNNNTLNKDSLPANKICTNLIIFIPKPVIIYNDSLLNKFNALDNNLGKSGIYR